MPDIIPLVRIIAVLNQKGGVGKTTTVANLGAAIAARGHDICLVDLEPQSQLTLHFGAAGDSPPGSIYDVLTSEVPIASTALEIGPHLWLVPSVIDLAAAEVELATTVGREQILRDCLAECPLACEFVMIDCPPSLGLLTLNALAAADEVLIPMQAHFLALQGLGKLLETVALVQRRINPGLWVRGLVLCMFEKTTRLAAEVVADVEEFLAAARGADVPWSRARILSTAIRRNVKLAESPSYGSTIFDYEPNSHGAEDYGALAEEFLSGCLPAGTDSLVVSRSAEPSASEETPQGEGLSPPLAPQLEEVPQTEASPGPDTAPGQVALDEVDRTDKSAAAPQRPDCAAPFPSEAGPLR